MPGAHENLVGKTIAGYEILELVGEGGMGAVYRARQLSLDREVALKMLNPRLADNEEFVARFKREARSIAKINHSNILQVYDVIDVDGLHFILMEFVCGHSLSTRLKDTGFLEWQECSDYIRQAALGLASAAKAGIIHRDIKPDNLMITEDKIVKVSDFGLAKEVSSAELTQTGDLMGTPAYMSPEQCDGGRLDTRTDIYSLGATYYRAITGVLPFNAPTPVAMMYKHKHEPLIPPSQYMPSLPHTVDRIIQRMMAKTPEERFGGMDEVAAAIESALKGEALPQVDTTMKISSLHASAPPAPPVPKPAPSAVIPFPDAPVLGPSGPAGAGPSFEELVALGDKHAGTGHILAACDCWRRALELRPGDPGVRQRLERTKKESHAACLQIGEGLLEQGRLSSQRAELQRLLQIDPENVEAREKLAALDFMEQQRRGALLEIRKMLSSQELEKALELWESIHPTLRDKALAPTMDNLKSKVLPCQKLATEAQALTEKGAFEEAFAKWDEAIAIDPTNDRVKLGRQETQRYFERMETALRDGYEYNVKRKYEAAIGCFEQVLQIAPEHAQAKRYVVEALTELARASEAHHDFDTAATRWKQALDRQPGDKSAMERLEHCTRQRNALVAQIDNAKEALQKGRYTRSTAMFRRALTIQPDNKTAIYGLAEAQRQRFRKRIVPLLLLTLVGLATGGVILHLQFQQKRDIGDMKFRQAREGSPDAFEDYTAAIHAWEQAGLVPIFSTVYRTDLARRIAQARIYTEMDKEERAYRAEDLKDLQDGREARLTLLDSADAALAAAEIDGSRFRIEWHIADLLARNRDYLAAKEVYLRAQRMAEASDQVHFPLEQDNRRRAITNYLNAKAILATKTGDPVDHERQAGMALQDAVRQWPEFQEAKALLDEIGGRRTTIIDKLKLARKLVETAAVSEDAGHHQDAKEKFDQALEAARAVLDLQPGHWDARKIEAEVTWRRQAGPDMIFFVYPCSDDIQMARKFRAFALDRFEWPNEKGKDPATASFKQARESAQAVGKDLPYLEEWLYAAKGKEQDRAYAYGNEYTPTKGNTGNQRTQPWPCGSQTKARTSEGLFDLTGNVAEWVRDRRRDDEDEQQYAAGGHFASTPATCRNDHFQLYDSRITHKHVGFRAGKSWELKRE